MLTAPCRTPKATKPREIYKHAFSYFVQRAAGWFSSFAALTRTQIWVPKDEFEDRCERETAGRGGGGDAEFILPSGDRGHATGINL